MKEIKFNVLLGYLILVLVAAITSAVGLYIASKFKEEPLPTPPPPPPVATSTPISLHPEFDSLSEAERFEKLILLPRVKSYTPNGDVETYSHRKYLQPVGELSRMYLYTEVSFNGGKLTGARDLYVKFNNLGGHIKNRPLPVPDSSISRLLYDSDNIQYVETIMNPKIEAVSWLDIFSTAAELGKNVRMDVFASSREEAWIEKMELYYQCAREVECSIIEVSKVE